MVEGSAPLPVCDIPNVIIPVVLAYTPHARTDRRSPPAWGSGGTYPALSENRPPSSTGLGVGRYFPWPYVAAGEVLLARERGGGGRPVAVTRGFAWCSTGSGWLFCVW
jgi:hypothetical protein